MIYPERLFQELLKGLTFNKLLIFGQAMFEKLFKKILFLPIVNGNEEHDN